MILCSLLITSPQDWQQGNTNMKRLVEGLILSLNEEKFKEKFIKSACYNLIARVYIQEVQEVYPING
jgi:hypothetical protein